MAIQKSIARAREPIVVYTLPEWCKLRKVSKATARRLNKAGRLKFTKLSERRIGVRSDHDLEYLDSCEVQS
jgi:predicted site-specific integrase-resolvase